MYRTGRLILLYMARGEWLLAWLQQFINGEEFLLCYEECLCLKMIAAMSWISSLSVPLITEA